MSDEREKGIEAIIKLQALANIEESREKAEKNWDLMNDWEKENTMAAYKVLIGDRNANDD